MGDLGHRLAHFVGGRGDDRDVGRGLLRRGGDASGPVRGVFGGRGHGLCGDFQSLGPLGQAVHRLGDLAFEAPAELTQDLAAHVDAGVELGRSGQLHVQQRQLHQGGDLPGRALARGATAPADGPSGPGVADHLEDHPIEQRGEADGVPAAVHAHFRAQLAERAGAGDIVGVDPGRRQGRPGLHMFDELAAASDLVGLGGERGVVPLQRGVDLLQRHLGRLIHQGAQHRERLARLGRDAQRLQSFGQVIGSGHGFSPRSPRICEVVEGTA